MGVYIKDMEIPDRCVTSLFRRCQWYTEYGGDYDWTHACMLTCRMNIEDADKRRPIDCPLVEVKEPHGRLIDADALIKVSGVTIQITGDENARVVAEALESIYQDIEDAPTVIEGSDT